MRTPDRKASGVPPAILVILAATLLFYGCSGGGDSALESPSTSSSGTTSSPSSPEERAREQTLASPEKADTGELATEIESVAQSYPGSYGVAVWHPASGERASVNAQQSFEAASLAKLPVLLALYREAASGGVDLDEEIQLQRSDIQPGTGALQHEQPGKTLTLRELAHYLVSESDNTAWGLIERRLGEERVQEELESIGTTSTNYEYGEHATTPQDVLKMLEHISEPDYTSPRFSEEMLSHMTETSFEDRLPEGVPSQARVAHKIGILGDGFSDAGVVYPAQDDMEERYYIVVFSKGSPEASSRAAMQEISSAAYEVLAEPAE